MQQHVTLRLAQALACSRRDAKRLIFEGRVKINGVTLLNTAAKLSGQDLLSIDDKLVVETPEEAVRVWLYYKPVGLITTHKDPQGRPTVFDSLPNLIPVLRTFCKQYTE